jgi:hemerythrin
MAIKWNENLAVGVSEIDEQHRELFDRLNKLLEACNQGKGKEAVASMIDYLEAYVVKHFSAEEKLQRASGYPQFKAHQAMHAEFMQKAAGLKAKLEEQGPALPFVITVNKTVVDWVTNHISKADRDLGQYLQGKSRQGKH